MEYKPFNMKKFIGICILIVVVIAGIVWYYIPIKSTATIELYCNDPNESSIYAEFDLEISRSLFSPPKIDGTVRIGDKEYVRWTWQKYGFFTNILRKVKGEIDIPCFINSANFGQGQDILISDLLWIYGIQFGDNYTIENVGLSMSSDDRGSWCSDSFLSWFLDQS